MISFSSTLLLLAGLTVLGPSTSTAIAAPWGDTPYRYCGEGTFEPASTDQLDQVRQLTRRALNGESMAELVDAWRRLDMDLAELQEGIWLLREHPDHCRGRGIFLFRPGSTGPFVQAPHSYRDQHTGQILSALIEKIPFAMAAWNNIPRDHLDRVTSDPADLARRDDTYLMAMSGAFAEQRPSAPIVQLHGFSAKKRRTLAGAAAQIIVSAGTTKLSAPAAAIGRCLKTQFENVRFYGDEVMELGATGNSIGRMLRQHGSTAFVHLELVDTLRDRLRLERDALGFLATCLSGNSHDT